MTHCPLPQSLIWRKEEKRWKEEEKRQNFKSHKFLGSCICLSWLWWWVCPGSTGLLELDGALQFITHMSLV